jgi:hypothetical protein
MVEGVESNEWEESHAALSPAPLHDPVIKGRQRDVEDPPFHGAGGAHLVLLPRASDEGEMLEEKDLRRRRLLGFDGTREWHGRGRRGKGKK